MVGGFRCRVTLSDVLDAVYSIVWTSRVAGLGFRFWGLGFSV